MINPKLTKDSSSSDSDTESHSDKSDKGSDKKGDQTDDENDTKEAPVKTKKGGLRMMNDIASDDEEDS